MKTCFIIPFFGKLPNYFNLFLRSCEHNIDFDWLVFTDDYTNYEIPSNVKFFYMSFDALVKYISSKFDFSITLETPYKLCDYKPAYGYIFEEYLDGYDFWGHCDTDIILGNLKKFVSFDILSNYDKVFCLGHMTLYKNTYENNRVFMAKTNKGFLYKKVFSTNKICWFDEEYKDDDNINQIFKSNGHSVFETDFSLNISQKYIDFRKTTYIGRKKNIENHGYLVEEKKDSLVVWFDGNLSRYYIDKHHIVKEEYPYIHLQGRKMKIDDRIVKCSGFKIIPNSFSALSQFNMTEDDFMKMDRGNGLFNIYYLHLKSLINRVKRKIK